MAKLIGKNFTPTDVIPKVTGRAKYAEDFRAEGMVFMKLFISPMPHAKVRKIDSSKALKLEGVLGILTADDVPQMPAPGEQILTNEPHYVGEPILAVAAITEEIAADALELIKVDLQPLPFVTDPLDSLAPGGPNARTDGNVANWGIDLQEVKWTARDFAVAGDGELPMGKTVEEWEFGDLEDGFSKAALVIDESFVTQSNAHHSMEPRSAMAYWEGEKCTLHASCQSMTFAVPFVARFLGIPPQNLRFISETTGGGFGGKGAAYPQMVLPAYMSKKIGGRPVMFRVTRSEEYFFGSSRNGFQGRAKIGFAADGRILAADLFVVTDNGPTSGFPDFRNYGVSFSIVYQPLAMRWRGIPVLTNTTPTGAQRGPGENQTAVAIEPLIDKAARELGIDRIAIRRINAPGHDGKIGGKQGPITSSYLPEAIDQAAERFNWTERKTRSGQRNGNKLTGIGIGTAYHSAGANGFDGLVRILPDGKVHIHSGVGNLGTYSWAGTSRIVAEVLECEWDDCVIERGDTNRHLPWNLGQFGSNTSFTMMRSNYAAATDVKEKLLELAAIELGGDAKDYELKNGSVVSTSDSSKSLSYAAAAKKAIELGGKFDGHELAEDLNPLTAGAATAVAGTGLVGASKDRLERVGTVPALSTALMEIELDAETGKIQILDYICVADCGTVIHPDSLATQIRGGAVMGFGFACAERAVYDPKLGLPGARGFNEAKPFTYLDVPPDLQWGAVDKPDPQNPVGTKGVGEPVYGSGAAALVSAISDALGGHTFKRSPITPDMIVLQLAGLPQSNKPLQANTQ